MDGIKIIRLPTYIARNEGFFRRTLDFLTFMAVSTIASIFLRRHDVVVATSPQFFSAVAGFLVAALRRRPFVFEVSDLWPASIAAVGAMSRGKVYRALEAIELFLYRRAASVIVLTAAFRDDLIRRGVAAGKIAVVINGVDLSRYEKRTKDAELLKRFGLEDKFVLGYIGTHGMAHGLENAIAAAEILRDNPRFRLLLVGDGACKPALERQAAEDGLRNVIFAPAQAKSMMPRFWSICDAALIHLKDDAAFSEVIPSKIFEAMAMGLPLLVAAPPGEASRIVEREAAGIRVSSAEPNALADVALCWMDDAALLRGFAESSLRAANLYSREKQASTFVQVLIAAACGRGAAVSLITNATCASSSA
jgi:glycosyltransferase involved in cell wall biosynthesis